MKFSECYASKYLKASDLPSDGSPVRAKIFAVQLDKVGKSKEEKVVLILQGGVKKPLILNKTNATTLAHAFGDDMESWEGQAILLHATTTSFAGEEVDCIRVKIPKPAAPAPTAATAPPKGPRGITPISSEATASRRSSLDEEVVPVEEDATEECPV